MEKTTLFLTLSKEPFEVMATGEKSEEFRKPSEWIKSRLYDKEGNPRTYDHVKFVNGYGCDKPQFCADFKGFEISQINQTIKYSNGLIVLVEKGDIKINLGSVFYRSQIQ
ncbi:conserved protein of unknown function [Tenacibaculum sp. 190524A02b]|uniref:hypothetical protein n=1 Tax=Tenacibaculum vairaonense TaxID=3137860 RepID=UPI0032B28D20